jgi:hypothetical protein
MILLAVSAYPAGRTGSPSQASGSGPWSWPPSPRPCQRDDGAYVGFLTDEDPARVRQAYPGSTWDRLVQVKARYDPTSLSHHNRNIPTTINKPGQ